MGQRILHRFEQPGREERLPQQRDFRIEQLVGLKVGLGVSGYVQHRYLGPAAYDALAQLAPIHDRHDQIGDDQVNVAGYGFEHVESGHAMRRLQHPIAGARQGAGEESADDFLIIHYQDGWWREGLAGLLQLGELQEGRPR